MSPDSAVPGHPTVIYSIPGAGRPDGCTVASGVPLDRFSAGTTLYLGFGRIPDVSGFPTGDDVRYIDASVGPQGTLQHSVEGAASYTRYVAGLSTDRSGSWIGDPIRFRTYPGGETATPLSIKWAYGSCQNWFDDGPKDGQHVPLQTAWADLIDYAPDMLWDTGDFHYMGGNKSGRFGPDHEWQTFAKMYWGQLAGLDVMRRARALVIEDQVADDHEFSSNNGESCLPGPPHGDNLCGPARQVQMRAMRHLFASHPLHDADRGLYTSYLLTPRVRVIILDGESLDRSYGQQADSPAKSFLGATQTGWLKETLTSPLVTLNLLVSGKAWIGDSIPPNEVPGGDDVDKIWAYGAWRQDFASWLTTYNHEHDKKINLVWMGGDRHSVGVDDGTNNQWGGFPCLVGSGWSMKPLATRVGEMYQAWYPYGTADPALPDFVMQYLRGTIGDNQDGQVSLTAGLRIRDVATGQMTDAPIRAGVATMRWAYVD